MQDNRSKELDTVHGTNKLSRANNVGDNCSHSSAQASPSLSLLAGRAYGYLPGPSKRHFSGILISAPHYYKNRDKRKHFTFLALPEEYATSLPPTS